MIVRDQPRLLPSASGGPIRVAPVPLRRDDPSSPWCYAASLAPVMPVCDDDAVAASSAPPPRYNALATQVWPSARVAAAVLERHADPAWTVCELGCGPGLPSLAAAAAAAARRVIATDVDAVALELVRAAAAAQGLLGGGDEDGPRFVTQNFDLTSKDALPEADLYVLSDVFESGKVARGAAQHVTSLLSGNRSAARRTGPREAGDLARVWVFAQSDRAQREVFLSKVREWYEKEEDGERQREVGWTLDHEPNHEEELWLFDLDETGVTYN